MYYTATLQSRAATVLRLARQLQSASVDDLRSQARAIRWRLQSGEPHPSLITEVFPLGFEAIRRTLGLELYPVQALGGMVMAHKGIAEMQTGEGKTITAVLPAILFGLSGKGCHVVTVNDYLASRDAGELKVVYNLLGLSVGCITLDLEPEARRQAYSRDITYGTSKEMGFDFLRDRMQLGVHDQSQNHESRLYQHARGNEHGLVQRGQFCALVDEADSVLIDEARTPLLIGVNHTQPPKMVALYRWCSQSFRMLDPDIDFLLQPKKRRSHLTDHGSRKVSMIGKPSLLDTIDPEQILETMERTLDAHYFFESDRHYGLQEDEIVLLDESTGRIMDGRKLQQGLHHCLEAKEGVPITAGMKNAARITLQSFFRQYDHLAGMTGTASNAKREFRRTYKLKVHTIPTHRPCIRRGEQHRVFASLDQKWSAIAVDVLKKLETGRAVLIGTPSVAASERLSQKLTSLEIPHQVLNARFEEMEAEIIANAGQHQAVTVATNMAGRGTDIKLADSVREAGGLHVIATEMHSSARIDRQLVGRGARQGDPGSYQFFLSLEDELLAAVPTERLQRYQKKTRANVHGELSRSWVKLFRRTQRFLERQHRTNRKKMLKYEKKQAESYRRIGLNPFLEAADV